MKKHSLFKTGNVSVMLVVTIILLVTITTAAVALAVSTTRDTTTFTLGERALAVAESGAENAILLLLRNPSYLGDSNLPIGPGTATIEVTGTNPIIIISMGVVGNLSRRIQVTVTQSDDQLSVSSWQEI